MSDEEEVVSGSEEEAEPESPQERAPPAAPAGPSEADVALLKRRAQQQYADLDEAAQELLAQNKVEQEAMGREISEMRARRERRIKERAEEEQRMAQRRAEEEAKRKAEEEERKRKKEEEESVRREERAKKMAELDKLKNSSGTRNFQITKRETSVANAEPESGLPKKSKEELEAEKKAILSQRIQPLEISGFDASKLTDKAKELYSLVRRLEGDKYDLEKRFKAQQRDMLELANKARQINKVGKEGTIKRVHMAEDDVDKIQERFAGAPAKVVMFSEFERQKDKRSYDDKKTLFKGPVYGFPAERIKPSRILKWDENSGQPVYIPMEGAEQEAAAEE